jgi:hypothetical protein
MEKYKWQVWLKDGTCIESKSIEPNVHPWWLLVYAVGATKANELIDQVANLCYLGRIDD